jgi:cation transport ATPase
MLVKMHYGGFVMHDVHRDSMLYKGTLKKTNKSDHKHQRSDDQHSHEHGGETAHDHDHKHDHPHEAHEHDHGHEVKHDHHDHDDEIPHGHRHDHEESAYAKHEHDEHGHSHEHGSIEDRAFTHVHDHGHNFFHSHHHSHHPEHTSAIHRVFGDPLRDWFAVLLMIVLIGIGYFSLLPEKLSSAMLLCAAVIGIFPLLKNALFESIVRRTFSVEIILGVLLIGGLLLGSFLQVALISLCLLMGSFLRLDFSW